MKSLSCVRLFATPWTAAHQTPPSMRFSRQEYWSGVPSPSLCYVPKVLQFPGGPMVKTQCFIAMSPDSILGQWSNIPKAMCKQPPPPPKKFPKVLLTQLPFFNLCSFGALSFDQIWSDQPWKSHWKIFNWTMLISISFISQWPWRLEICVITSIVLLFSECVSTCMHCWIKDLS